MKTSGLLTQVKARPVVRGQDADMNHSPCSRLLPAVRTCAVGLLMLPVLLSLGACSKPAPGPASTSADPSSGEVKVEITANDQMKFDIATIAAKPGQKVTVTLRNIGTMPKLSMGHNFVVLVRSMDPMKFIEASQMQMANEYIAPELRGSVIAHTKLLGPGESDTISFTAPRTPGDYPFLCSFPGHFTIGMKGVLSVH